MKMGVLVLALLFLAGCGDSGSGSPARSLSEVCDEMCAWPDECFVQLGAMPPGDDCAASCQAQAELVGVECMASISDTIDCLGTCDLESITEQQALACQDEAMSISNACE
jgi:hypothetical protein